MPRLFTWVVPHRNAEVHPIIVSDDRIWPLTSSSRKRCIITTMAACFESFRRVVEILLHEFSVRRRSASDTTSATFVWVVDNNHVSAHAERRAVYRCRDPRVNKAKKVKHFNTSCLITGSKSNRCWSQLPNSCPSEQ
jgi:hypothetical protein